MQLSSSHCSHLEVTLARCQRCCSYSDSSKHMAKAVSSVMRPKQIRMKASVGCPAWWMRHVHKEPLGDSGLHRRTQLPPSLAASAPSDDLPLVLQLFRVGGGCLAVLGVV